MRFLTYAESAEWCGRHGYPTHRRHENPLVGPEPDIQPSPDLHRVDFALPTDSGKKVWLARVLYDTADRAPEMLIWLGDWAVWDACHMPLFTRFRQAFGEHRPLIEAPAHVVGSDEIEDGLSIFIASMLFFWDCHMLTASGRDAVFISHDEVGWFGSRDLSVVQSLREQLKEAGIKLKA